MKSHPFVTVIIPVFNDADRLARCLESLENQTWPQDRFEVMVVDNGSEHDPADLADRFPRVRWEHEARPGSYAARNRGVEAARGEILAFTDSDTVPARDWIAGGVATLMENTDAGLVGGRIDLFFRNSDRLTPAEVFERQNAFRQENKIREHRFAVTANLFTRKEIMDRVGPFDAGLKSGGDVEWGNRVHRAGYPLVYAPAARVWHPARRTFRELYRKTVRVAGGLRDWKGCEYRRVSLVPAFFRTFRIVAGLVRRFALKQPPFQDFRNHRERLFFVFAVAFVETTRNVARFRLYRGAGSRR